MLPGGRGLSRNRLAGRMIDALLGACNEFEAEGLAAFREDWNRVDVLAGREVTLDQAGGPVRGRAMGIDDRGALRLERDGRVEAFLSGDTRLRANL
jgi:BirA family biotin operon repressor/biotin-[acetyl-CoA-carboxylase] ligase